MMRNFECLLLVSGILLAKVAANSSDQMHRWHSALMDRLIQRNRNGELSTFPYCRNKMETENLTLLNLSDARYLKFLRSVNTSVLDVRFDLAVSQVVEVNERHRLLTLKMLVTTYWTDCRLIWSLEEFPIERIYLSNLYFRKLDLFVPHLTMMEELDTHGSDAVEHIVEIWHDYIVLSKRYITTVSCNIDVSLYPLDTQFCNLTFESVLERTMVSLSLGAIYHEAESENRINKPFRIDMGRYMPNDAWDVKILGGFYRMQNSCIEMDSEDDTIVCTYTDTIIHTLVLRRHPTYQLVNLMFPAYLIVMISGCVFLVPPGTSDKMSLSLTSLLSLYIFTQIMYEKMPETGETLPLLSQYFLSSVALVSLSCVASSLSAFLDSRMCPKFWLSNLLASDKQTRNDLPSVMTSPENGTCDHRGRSTAEMRRLVLIFDRVFFVIHFVTSSTILIVYVLRGYIPWKHYGFRDH